MKLTPEEKRIEGKWEMRDGHVTGDAACRRIKVLTAEHLEEVATDASGWDTLYRDPRDGRYWELIYLQSEMHGGGPPSLIQIEGDAVKSKYGMPKR